MTPYISNTEHICYYDNYRIEKLLKKRKNVIEIILGNGFRNPFGGFVWGFDKSKQRCSLCLVFFLEAFDEHNIFELEADERVKTHPSAILYDDMRMGYCYDERFEIKNWCMIDFDDLDWNRAFFEKLQKE